MTLLTLVVAARAQVSFTGEYTNDFNSYTSIATLPTGWTNGGTGGFIGSGTGSGTGGGFYSFYPSCCSGDRALGALHSGSATGYYQVTFTNTTGSTITSLTISYDFEQYRAAGNNTGWTTLFNGASNAALSASGVTSGVTTGVPYVETRTATLTGLSIAAGASFYIKWTVNDASGSDNPVAIDNFKMCVPGNAFDVTASNTSPVSAPAPVTLSASATGGTATYTYSWAGPVGFSSISSSPVINPSSVANSGTYTATVTDAVGCTAKATTTVTVNPGTSCSGTPTSGTAAASPSSFCASGVSTVTVTGATAASGLTYQWQMSSTGGVGSFTNIGGATDALYTTPTVTSTTYYRLVTTCSGSGLSDTSTVATLTINPLPSLTATPSSATVCAGGGGVALGASGASSYTWTPATGLSATTGSSVTANPTTDVTYTITGTDAAGCINTTTTSLTYNLTPTVPAISPTAVSACLGGSAQMLTATGGTVGPTTVNSGTITLPGSVGAFGTMTDAITVAGIPSGATITGASVKIITFGSQYQADYVINIQAPNGNILNLIRQRGSSTSAVTTLFSNTTVSSNGIASLAGGSGTFTGTWAADAFSGVGNAPNASNVTNWSSLYSIPNGDWKLSINNVTSFTNTVLPSAAWSITLNYAFDAPLSWSPVTNLYTDAAATSPYTGGTGGTVYFDPATLSSTTYTVTATNGSCSSSATVTATVNPLPAATTGTMTVCEGLTTTLSNTTAGGTWSSGSTANATVDASGVVTGVLAGTATITYTLPTGCYTTAIVTVNALPDPITGTTDVCVGSTTTLSSSTVGGTWSSGTPANATISATGLASGVMAGTSAITYASAEGCITTADVTVNPLPAAITGTTAICEGLTTSLSNTTAGGTWSSGSTANATVDASGVVTGVLAGTATITYTLPTGCYTTAIVTVNALPDPITGTTDVCVGSTTTLSSATTGGTWSSGTPANATISATGIASGITAGTSAITYASAEGCITTAELTVNPLPAAITGTVTVCEGLTTTLSNTTAGGTWSSGSTANATVDASGVVTGVLAGTATITYTLPTGCYTTAIVTVNALPAAITGTLTACEGLTTTLSNATTGGTWSSGTPANATINAAGTVTGILAGTSQITYASAEGCIRTTIVTINALPASITGITEVCVGSTTALANATSGGTWSSGTTNASVDAAGVVTGAVAGTSTITYMLSTGCITTAVISVNPLPTISGSLSVCEGSVSSLTASVAGGTWLSASTAIATITAGGLVSGLSAGTSVISYTTPSGCLRTATVTVNVLPAAIGGTPSVCVGGTTALTNSGAGTWTSSNGLTTIGVSSGIATGVAVGTSTITFTLATGCYNTIVVTVNPLPSAITGAANVCEGSTTTLSSPGGGSWSSSNSNASVDASTGVVTGNSAGTARITYTLSTGCLISRTITVYALPAAIGGTSVVCAGASAALTGSGGGTWSSSNSNTTITPASGIMTGVTAGTSVISYTLSTGCFTTTIAIVNALPSVFSMTGGGSYCAGGSGVNVGLSNSATGIDYQLYNGTSPTGTPVAGTGSALNFGLQTVAGAYTVMATDAGTGCTAMMTGTAAVTITPLVTPAVTISTAFGDTVCSGLPITFTALPVNGGATPTYEWKVNGTIVGTPAATYVYTPANNDHVSVTMSSVATCASPVSATDTDTITVITSMVPSVSITASPGDHVCSGTVVTFAATSVNGGSAPAFLWSKNGINVATGPTYTIISLDGDMVICKLYSSLACRTADSVVSNTLTMSTEDATTPPSVTISATPGTTIAPGTPVMLTAAVTGAGASASYQWYLNGSSIAGATTTTYASSSFADGDAVTFIATKNTACKESGDQTIAITISTAISNLSANASLQLFPNPNSGTFSVAGTDVSGKEVLIEMTNVLGQLVYRGAAPVIDNKLEARITSPSALTGGTYIVTVKSQNGNKVFHVTIDK